MDTRVPFDEDYVKLVGTAIYLFSYYEWAIIYVVERLEPGFVPECCRKHSRGTTSGAVSKRFMHAVERYAGDKGVEKTELKCCRLIFDRLVRKRNVLTHAHPITVDGGAQILNYQASLAKQMSDMTWELASLQEFVREFRCVWPLVVFLEPILGFGLASGLLVERFVHRIRNLLLQEYTSVRPVVFLDIEDIETIVQNIREGDFTFVDCLRDKLSHDEANFYSFSDFYWGSSFLSTRSSSRKTRSSLTSTRS